MDRSISSSPQATIRDVARLAGVSIKTVSRVINNKPHVRDETRLRVNTAVEKLEFKPNALARQLGSMRKKTALPELPVIAETRAASSAQPAGEIDWW